MFNDPNFCSISLFRLILHMAKRATIFNPLLCYETLFFEGYFKLHIKCFNLSFFIESHLLKCDSLSTILLNFITLDCWIVGLLDCWIVGFKILRFVVRKFFRIQICLYRIKPSCAFCQTGSLVHMIVGCPRSLLNLLIEFSMKVGSN